jgi:hypothetical protein
VFRFRRRVGFRGVPEPLLRNPGYQPGDVIVVIRFEDGTAEIAAMLSEQTVNELNKQIERKRRLRRSQF